MMNKEEKLVVGIYRDTLRHVLGIYDNGYDDNYAEILVKADVLRGWYERIGSPYESFDHWMWEYTLDDMEDFLDYCEEIGELDDVEVVYV